MEATENLKTKMLRLLKEDEEFRYAVAGLIGMEEILKRLDRNEQEIARLREDMIKGFERHDREIERLREDMNRGFELVNRHISALGARWGLMAEDAFRNGLRGVLEKELGLKVERWTTRDEEGIVYGYASEIEIDVAVKDGKTVLIEVSSSVDQSKVAAFVRKARLYEKKTGVKPDRLIMVTPYADEKAMKAAKGIGVEIYTSM